VVCTALDACHTAGTCDPTSGACSSPNRSDGFGCNDGNACTQNDHCESGACAGTTVDCDDHNLCTNDSCNTATGCTHANNTRACDDGNACTTNDACAAGSCAGGPALGCNDQNGCTNDSCNPATGCVHANNTVACNDGFACTTADACSGGVCVGGPPLTPDCKEPKSMGFYKRLCMGPHPEDELTQANVDCVNDWSTFATVTSIAGACRALNPDPSNDKCQQAAAQFMAALLNLCKGRLQMGEPIVSTCSNHLTVGNSLNDANAILTNPGRTDAACVGAQCETEELNSGRAVGAASLLANRIGGTIRVSWQQPPTGPGWSAPASYSVWRRPRGVGAFAVIATATGLSFDDLQSIPGTDFEYQVTVNW